MTVSHITATPCDLQGVSGKNSLVFVKQGNVLYISPDGRAQTPPEVFSLLHNHLSYDYKEFLYGWRARDQHTGKKRRIEVTQRRMYGTDQAGRLFTPFGFMRRCYNVLKSAGYAISYVDWNQHYESNHPRPKRYEPRWENVSRHFTYRLRQEECLTNISKSQCGVVHAVTGFGKMVIVAMICLLYPKAKIHVITRRVPLVNKLVEFLTRHIPNVGQFGDGQKRFGDRVTVFTCKSLGHSDFDADIVIGDECFVGSTLVSVPGGTRRIDNVRPGDVVYCANGLGTVDRVVCKSSSDLYQVEFDDGTATTCTGDHPYFTGRGWVSTRELVAGDCAYDLEAVRVLWETNPSLSVREGCERSRKARCANVLELEKAGDLLAILCEEISESDDRKKISRENAEETSGASPQTFTAWRQRAIAAFTAACASARAGRGLEGGAADKNCRASRIWSSDGVQGGHRQRAKEDRHRGRRNVASDAGSEGSRCAQNGVFSGPRVARVSRLEREGAAPVFNLRVSGHPSYFADGKLVHNCHELPTDDTSILLSRYQGCRMFGLTATPTGRSDGSDPRLEAYFGQTIFYLPYWEAAALGLVVPIRVEWSDVILDHNPAAGYEDVERKRHGIWFNAARNDIIAKDLLAVPKNDQLLVLTDTIFHAVQIYERIRNKREREPVLVYDKIDIERFKKYKDHGILPKDLSRMTADKKEELRRRFEAGEIDAISTTTWEVGIDPIYLQHLFIASSFSSEIKAQQAPGRATRVNTEGKELGIVRDYRDQFDDGFRRAAGERSRIYGSMRWEQVVRRGDELIPVKP